MRHTTGLGLYIGRSGRCLSNWTKIIYLSKTGEASEPDVFKASPHALRKKYIGKPGFRGEHTY